MVLGTRTSERSSILLSSARGLNSVTIWSTSFSTIYVNFIYSKSSNVQLVHVKDIAY